MSHTRVHQGRKSPTRQQLQLMTSDIQDSVSFGKRWGEKFWRFWTWSTRTTVSQGVGGSLDHLKVMQNGHDVLRHEDVAGINGHAGDRDQQGVWGGAVKELQRGGFTQKSTILGRHRLKVIERCYHFIFSCYFHHLRQLIICCFKM